MTGSWVIEMMAKEHIRDSFDCGEESLNRFLRKCAGQHTRKGVSKTYVAVCPPSRIVLGYYSLCAGCVEYEMLPDEGRTGLPRFKVPSMHLGRLAVDKSQQGRGLGGNLLIDVFRLSQRLAEEVGICAVTVDAISENARGFYVGHGFQPLLDDPFHLFIMMRTIRELGL